MNKKIIIKEPEMEHGTSIFKLIHDAYSFEAGKYGLEKSGKEIISIEIPKNLKLGKEFLKDMETILKAY